MANYTERDLDIADKLWADWKHSETTYPILLAQAIANERAETIEWCAKVAEDKATNHGWNYSLPSVGQEIAAAIRKGKP